MSSLAHTCPSSMPSSLSIANSSGTPASVSDCASTTPSVRASPSCIGASMTASGLWCR